MDCFLRLSAVVLGCPRQFAAVPVRTCNQFCLTRLYRAGNFFDFGTAIEIIKKKKM